MKYKRRIGIALIVCILAFSFFVLKYNQNGIHQRFGTQEKYLYHHGRIDTGSNGLVFEDGTWWYLNKGRVDTDYNGLVKYKKNLWYIRDGMIDRSYHGFVRGGTAWYFVHSGRVQSRTSGMVYGRLPVGVYGEPSGSLVSNIFLDYPQEVSGWWRVRNGQIDTSSMLVKVNNRRWWYVDKGRVQFTYRGIGENEKGKFYVTHGRVSFRKEGVYREDGCTYLLEHGKVIGEVRADSCKFVAHRGLNQEAPENTVMAFMLAGEAGYWGCETDVRLTADGRFVLNHDKTFSRMCDVKRETIEMTSEEIKEMQLVEGNHLEEYQMEHPAKVKIAFLEEYLHVCLNYHMVPVIDIKIDHTGEAETDYNNMYRLVNTVYDIMGSEPVVFISFDLEQLELMSQILDELDESNETLQYLTNEGLSEEEVLYLQEQDMELDVKDEVVNEAILERLEDMGISINVWTIDDIYEADALIKQGVDYITTNQKFW